ncbi:MAG TPA: hypothetical protein VFL47_14585, partial [Flavisolibacter sp.]|nr:hypothetical protein [Flavisolibacter sp.]
NQYIVSFTQDRALLEKIKEVAQTAVDLDPLSQHAQRAMAWALMLDGKKEQSFEAIDKCIRLNPKAASVIVSMALAYICQGDYVRGFKWLLETGHLTPSMPPGTKLCFALYYYHKKNYNESLQWTERKLPFNMPIVHLLHLSVCGQLYQTKQQLSDAVLELRDHAASIIDRILFDEDLKKEVLHGLQLAGFTVK